MVRAVVGGWVGVGGVWVGVCGGVVTTPASPIPHSVHRRRSYWHHGHLPTLYHPRLLILVTRSRPPPLYLIVGALRYSRPFRPPVPYALLLLGARFLRVHLRVLYARRPDLLAGRPGLLRSCNSTLHTKVRDCMRRSAQRASGHITILSRRSRPSVCCGRLSIPFSVRPSLLPRTHLTHHRVHLCCQHVLCRQLVLAQRSGPAATEG